MVNFCIERKVRLPIAPSLLFLPQTLLLYSSSLFSLS